MEGPPQLSEYEIAARTARADHRASTVTLLDSLKEDGGKMKAPAGNGFIIKLTDDGGCRLITCAHLVLKHNDPQSAFKLWARFFGAKEDAEVTIVFLDTHTDIALLKVDQLPKTSVSPTFLKFTRKKKTGTTVTLLSYFNPENLEKILDEPNPIIAKEPNAVPGQIIGPHVLKDETADTGSFHIPAMVFLGAVGAP